MPQVCSCWVAQRARHFFQCPLKPRAAASRRRPRSWPPERLFMPFALPLMIPDIVSETNRDRVFFVVSSYIASPRVRAALQLVNGCPWTFFEVIHHFGGNL